MTDDTSQHVRRLGPVRSVVVVSPPTAPRQDDPGVVLIDYTNHRGQRDIRRILPDKLGFKATEWHPEPQWVLEAWDMDRLVRRSFAMRGVHSWIAGSSGRVG